MSPLVSEEAVQQYARDGAICLHGVFSSEFVNMVKAGIDVNIANPSPFGESLKGHPREGAYFDDYCNWERIPELEQFIRKSPAAEIAGTLMQSQVSAIYHEHVLNKEPNTVKQTPWHHDQSYYPIDGFKVCSVWMPVDPVPFETSIQFVQGSHLWDKWFYPRKFATAERYPMEDTPHGGRHQTRIYHNVPSEEIDAGKYSILRWAVQPGDCIVFHMRTVHGAPGNASTTTQRRVLSTRWLGDDAVMASRPWQVSPPMTAPLQPGDSAICKYFPTIWRRP